MKTRDHALFTAPREPNTNLQNSALLHGEPPGRDSRVLLCDNWLPAQLGVLCGFQKQDQFFLQHMSWSSALYNSKYDDDSNINTTSADKHMCQPGLSVCGASLSSPGRLVLSELTGAQ